MSLPFSLQQFLDVFRAYNSAIGPAPLLLSILAIALVVLARSRLAWRHRAIAAGLALLWIWSGVVYHLGFFARINPAAKAFGVLFVVQGLIFLFFSLRSPIRFSPQDGWSGLSGWALLTYAIAVYPLLGLLNGHGYPAGPSFGAPCPIVIFTLGMLAWTGGPVPLTLLAIPMAWAAIGTSAATALGITEDYALAVGALLVGITVLQRRRNAASIANPDSAVAA